MPSTPGAPNANPTQPNPFAPGGSIGSNFGGNQSTLPYVLPGGNPFAPGGNIGSSFGGMGGAPADFGPLPPNGQLPYGSTNGTFVPPQGFDPNAHYTPFNWNNISPTTRGFLGYQGR